MNRDEQRDRKEWSTPVTLEDTDHSVSMTYPVDDVSGGTWFGINSRGLVAALLNRYQDSYTAGSQSRGLIIPQVLKQSTPQQLHRFINQLDWYRFNPFDLVTVWRDYARCYRWNGITPQSIIIALDTAWFISSSSERLNEVLCYRQSLFNHFIQAHESASLSAETILNELHLQHEPDHASASINMSRPRAHTKSISQAVLEENRLSYRYLDEQALADYDPQHPWQAGTQQTVSLT